VRVRERDGLGVKIAKYSRGSGKRSVRGEVQIYTRVLRIDMQERARCGMSSGGI